MSSGIVVSLGPIGILSLAIVAYLYVELCSLVSAPYIVFENLTKSFVNLLLKIILFSLHRLYYMDLRKESLAVY